MKTHRPFPIALALVITSISAGRLAADDRGLPSSPGVKAALQPFVDSHSLAGAVAIAADKDKILSLDTVGSADIAASKAMPADALFWIASQSKPITGTALMLLVDEGKVNVEDPVEKYLPEFRGQWLSVLRDAGHVLLEKPKHPITVRNVLTHTSGLPFKSAMEEPTLDLFPLLVGARSYAMTPLEFEPDTKYQYSNAGINTAGRIIEVVSGMPYEKFLDERLFKPLGMKDTTFWPKGEQLGRIAKSYKPSAAKDNLEETTVGQLKYPLDDPSRQPMPAGGLFSSGADLVRFCQMVLRGGELDGKRYLSEAAVNQMTSKQTGALNDGYGFGWACGGDWCGHGGAFATNMTIDKKRGLITIWLIQHAGFPGNGGEAGGTFKHAAEVDLDNAKK